ncbi:hypothetical protein ACLMJK_008912 [Lecanora helva]
MANPDGLSRSLAHEVPNHSNADMIAWCRAQQEVHDENEATESDSSSSHRTSFLSRSRAKKARKAGHQNQKSNRSLRPANDILSRIRHDPALDQAEYIVGYQDRHAGVMEMAVSAWKGGDEVTDEDWIPQHRILYFRKEGDKSGRKIWDRAARLDRLFGSGIVPDDHQAGDMKADLSTQDNPFQQMTAIPQAEEPATNG